jgi:hypothetical protein
VSYLKWLMPALISLMLISCGGASSSSNFTGSSTTPVIFTEQLHDDLPNEWVTKYNTIKTNLLSFLPLYQTFYKKIFVYAWQSDTTPDPYSGVSGGSYISGGGLDEENSIRFVMEIQKSDIDSGYWQPYAVIVHEYFHTYQKTLNSHMNKADDHATSFKTKWLVEGAAAVVEGIYIKQNYGYNYIANDKNDVSDEVYTTPELYEDHNSSVDDRNYSSSVFLVLVLAKELQIDGYTEIEAFRLILRDYMAASPNKLTWKTKFDETFGMTVDDFYAEVKTTYRASTNLSLVPTAALTLEEIFE